MPPNLGFGLAEQNPVQVQIFSSFMSSTVDPRCNSCTGLIEGWDAEIISAWRVHGGHCKALDKASSSAAAKTCRGTDFGLPTDAGSPRMMSLCSSDAGDGRRNCAGIIAGRCEVATTSSSSISASVEATCGITSAISGEVSGTAVPDAPRTAKRRRGRTVPISQSANSTLSGQ